MRQLRAAATLLVAFGPLAAHAAGQSAGPCADGTGGPRLLVTATGARKPVGNITFTLYGEDGARFLAHHGSLALIRVPLAGAIAQACFAVSAPGTYALAIYHDANNNHHFDRTLIGLPAEGYGFSNDAPATLGLPAFTAVTFTASPGDTRLVIKLRYPS